MFHTYIAHFRLPSLGGSIEEDATCLRTLRPFRRNRATPAHLGLRGGTLLSVDAALRRKLYRHVRRQLDAHRIRATWTEGWEQAEAFPTLREAVLPRIRTGEDYLVALHEIGHIAYPEAAAQASDTGAYGVVACEGAAWAWAAAAVPPALGAQIPEDAWLVVGECFGSHFRWAALPQEPATAA